MYNSKSDLFVFHDRLKVKQSILSVSKQGQKFNIVVKNTT